MLGTFCTWGDWPHSWARPVKTLRIKVNDGLCRRQPRSPAMPAGLTNHICSLVKEPLMTTVALSDYVPNRRLSWKTRNP
jgi:hypothetical protein